MANLIYLISKQYNNTDLLLDKFEKTAQKITAEYFLEKNTSSLINIQIKKGEGYDNSEYLDIYIRN